MPTLNQLRGLKASDRTEEEQKAINQQMGYKEEPDTMPVVAPQASMPIRREEPTVDTTSAAMINQAMRYKQHLDEQYQQALAEREEELGTSHVGAINSGANDYLDKVAGEVSSYYKRFRGTDKLPLDDEEKKQIVAQYDARKKTYGEQNADIWLDNYMKDKVANNQSWWEQATNAVGHLIPAIEGGAIQTYGMLHGALAHIFGAEGYGENEDLNWWDSFMNDVIDNPVTRYGRDVEMAGASNVVQGAFNLFGMGETAEERIAAMKNSATKYNPEGLGEDVIATTNEQDETYFNATTPWQALQSGGFTALSMLTGAGEAKAAAWLFGRLAQGANWLNKTGRILKTEKALENTLTGLKRAQNFTDIAIIPGAVGSVEGAMEGLNTKIEVERDAVQKLDEYYKDKVSKEAEELFNNAPMVDMGDGTYSKTITPDEAFKQVWDKYQNEYTDARRQIDWASSKAGIHNFYANSLINGMMNTTLKAGLMAPRVQETLRNSKMFGWAYRNPRFNINPETGEVTSRLTKLGAVKQVLKEPFGEGAEEYLQSLSNDVFSSAAENNIDEFIKNKFEGNGTAKVTDSFGSDYAAALTALEGSLTNKESIESAILGAVSSSMGTIGGVGRGYHRDEKGNLVRNSLLDPRNFTRGLDSEGNQESWTDFARRVTPWRSGLINAYFDRRQEQRDADETAANMTEWLKDPQNKAKWDGLVGTANWMSQMENAAESNDQFTYRKAQMGKAINDVFMLSKLQGTDYYDSMMADLQRAASGEVTQEDIQKIRQNGGEEYQGKSDEEVVEKIQSNANKMLGLMTQVETESRNLDRLLGRVDEDTKQSLIFGKIMEQDFQERRDQLKQEIDTISQRINSSRSRSNVSLEDDLKALILQYGSLNKALKAEEQLQAQKEKTKQKVEQLEAIDPSKTSDKQKEELIRSKAELKKIDRQLEGFKGLYNEEGQVDSSLAQLVLNEEEIMNLDPVTRAMVLAQGANKLYNATHQNRQKVDQLNLEIDDIQHQIDALEAQKAKWTNQDGSIKKHHNKQVARNNQKIAELQKEKDKKMRTLDAEQGRMDSKPVYNSAQQEVIDNLVQQGMAQDADFLDKVVDMGRLEKGIKDYHTQYQAILSDPRAYQNYVQRAKYNAQRDLTRRRAERIAGIQNYQDYASELDRLTANASQQEMNEIMATLRAKNEKQKRQYQNDNMVVDEQTGDLVAPTEMPKTNFDRYMENIKKQGDLVRQFAKNPNLTDNDQSLLLDAMQYLSNQGIDVNDRDAAVQALIEKDEQGNIGGKFRQWVEAKNDMMPVQQRAFMPQFTSIGQIVGQYVDLLNGATEDAINRGNATPTITPATPQAGQTPEPTVVISPSPNSPSPSPAATTPQPQAAQPQGPSLFDVAYSSPEGGQIVDGNGTVATGAQTQSMQQRQQEAQQNEQKSVLRQLFEEVTTPEIAKMLDDASHIIDNSNLSAEAKGLARQYLIDLAVNNNERFDTLDDLMTAIQEQINRLKTMSEQQEEQENPYGQAAGLLEKVYGSLSAKKMRGRGRSLPMPSSRPENPRAAWIHTANIAYMERMNPDAWAVQFTNDHAIDEWNREHIITTDTPVYFITDSDWTAEVTRQMTGGENEITYDTLTDMPVVAAVRVEEPQNPATTTAIEVDGLWYQPIGIMPSSKSKSQGAERTLDIRKLASKEQGRHLVMENTTPTARPLATRVYGANYLTAHHPDAAGETNRQNTVENNTDVIEDILKTLPRESEDRLRAMPREEMLNDAEYMQARAKFLNGLVWGGNQQFPNNLAFIPDSRREGEQGSPMLVFTKDMAATTGRTSGRPLTEVLANGSGEEVVNFNSRTQRLYNEILRPIFQYLIQDRNNDRSAKLITQDDLTANPNALQEEAERLTKLLNGYDGTEQSKGIHGISDFIYVKPGSGWSIKVTAPEGLQVVGDLETSQSVYKVFFVNTDPSLQPIEIGTIRANQRDTDSAMELLRNIMFDAQTGQVRDFLNWQIPESDAQNLNNPDSSKSSKARQNYGAIVDDGLLEVAGSSLVYDVDGVKLQAPISTDGRIVYPQEQISNPVNATPAAPQNITPQGDGAIVTGNGQNVEPDSGANLGQGNPPTPPIRNKKLEDAKKITERIIADSKEFTLSEDETYYYITNKTTGEQEKYLRVTTVIGADESVPQWNPTIKQIVDKLRERHAIQELSEAQLATFKDINQMSQDLNIAVSEIRRAIAELRTEHKHDKYGAWSVPSTAVGNTADIITRDFLAGHLKESYPNITKAALDMFVQDLTLFKNNLESLGIHIIPEGVMAHGKITMTDADGNTHEVNVAGTLDLFGYDDNGNFFIFDMKTTRNHGQGKLQQEKAKWSRQISMYADLLKQSYPGFNISPNNLRIIPINVDYPTPMGNRNDHLDPNGPQYSVTDEGQLQMQYRGHEELQDFTGSNLSMRGHTLAEQFPVGYTPFNINWDNLSSEDQDIADALTTQTNDNQHSAEQAPQGAQIETPAPRRPSFIAPDAFIDDYSNGTQQAAPLAPPITPNGQRPVLPSWSNLTAAQKQILEDTYGIDNAEDYNELLNDPATAEGIAQDLGCKGVM